MCAHCLGRKGCGIYATRPAGCRDFYCDWMLSRDLGGDWKPDRTKFVLMVTASGHLTVSVDPDYPTAWRRAPYLAAFRRWAKEFAADPDAKWPAVDVWIGQRCIVILPDGEQDLGEVAPDEVIAVDLIGDAYRVRKFVPGQPSALGWLKRKLGGRA